MVYITGDIHGEIQPIYEIDGDIFEINGKQCIVIGGAYSVDKFYRLHNGWKQWPDEQPTPAIRTYVEDMLDYKAWYMEHWHIDKMHFLFHGVDVLES